MRLGKLLLESKFPSFLGRRKAKSGSTKDLRHVPSSLRRVEGVGSCVSHDAASPVSPETRQNTRRHSAESSARLPSGITLAVSRRRRRGPKTNRSARPRALPSIQIGTRMLFFQLPVFSITSSVRFTCSRAFQPEHHTWRASRAGVSWGERHKRGLRGR